MKIDLANMAVTPGARGSFPISETLPPTEGVRWLGPAVGSITVANVGSLLVARGQVEVAAMLQCVRCLAEGEQLITAEIEEEFACEGTAPDVMTIDREEPAESAISEYQLDLGELARQEIMANMPMGYVCRADCRGTCAECGKDLNQGDCGCAAKDEGSPWAKLGELLTGAGERGEEGRWRPEKDGDRAPRQ